MDDIFAGVAAVILMIPIGLVLIAMVSLAATVAITVIALKIAILAAVIYYPLGLIYVLASGTVGRLTGKTIGEWTLPEQEPEKAWVRREQPALLPADHWRVRRAAEAPARRAQEEQLRRWGWTTEDIDHPDGYYEAEVTADAVGDDDAEDEDGDRPYTDQQGDWA